MQVGTNIPCFITDSIGYHKQPFVLALGDNKAEPAQSFLIIEGRALPFAKILDALDTCFKSFYIFDLQYPKACYSTWDFIQKFVYKMMEDKGKASPPSVRSLRTFIISSEYSPAASSDV